MRSPAKAGRSVQRPLTITYLLEDTDLFGGTKIALHQANLMARRGHQVQVVSPGPLPDWYPIDARFVRLPATPLAATPPAELPAADVTVATYWTTLAPAAAAIAAAGRGEAVHYCQGFEAGYTHNQADHAAILAAYRLPLPGLAVAPHLAALLRRRFGRPARVVPQPLEPFWRPAAAPRPAPESTPERAPGRDGRPPRLLVISPFEIDWKGVATALAAVRRLRGEGFDCRLVRISQWPLGAAESELLRPDEFHHRLPPPAVARVVAGCDLLLAPSWEQEGFGLPVLEAMACGVPVVASDVSCYRDFAAGAAALVPYDDPAAFAAAARALLADPAAWLRARAAGLAVAASHAEERAAAAAEDALRWVAEGRWREARDATA